MNELRAKVSDIKESGSLHIVEFDYDDTKIHVMTLELPDIKIGSEVILSFKSTHVLVGKNILKDSSIDNQIKAKIKNIEIGELLVYMIFKTKSDDVEAVITKNSFEKMDLKKGMDIVLAINASEIFIKEVLS